MYDITFRKTAENEAFIYQAGEFVGELIRDEDRTGQGDVSYIVHLAEDPRGFSRIRDRAAIRDTVAHLLATHPLYR